jgi:hypothetical protein
MEEKRITRREIIKKAAYITPVILTLTAMPSFANNGSGSQNNNPPIGTPLPWR